MRRLGICLSFVLIACGDEDDRNAPPVGSGPSGPVGGGGAATATSGASSQSGSGGGSDSGGGSGGLTGQSTGSDSFPVLTGRFVDGGGGYALPIQCQVRFHRPGTINPATGISTEVAFAVPIPIDAFPESFTIMSNDIGNAVMSGEPGFVTSICDTNGDNLFDDGAGAFFPGLPLTEVEVPASSIDLSVGPL